MGICWLLYVRYSPVVSEGVYTSPGWMAGGRPLLRPLGEVRDHGAAEVPYRALDGHVLQGHRPGDAGGQNQIPVMVMSWRQAPSAALTITVPSTSWV